MCHVLSAHSVTLSLEQLLRGVNEIDGGVYVLLGPVAMLFGYWLGLAPAGSAGILAGPRSRDHGGRPWAPQPRTPPLPPPLFQEGLSLRPTFLVMPAGCRHSQQAQGTNSWRKIEQGGRLIRPTSSGRPRRRGDPGVAVPGSRADRTR